eukprot:9478959-Heterocapsa_arctica.AAC.1
MVGEDTDNGFDSTSKGRRDAKSTGSAAEVSCTKSYRHDQNEDGVGDVRNRADMQGNSRHRGEKEKEQGSGHRDIGRR